MKYGKILDWTALDNFDDPRNSGDPVPMAQFEIVPYYRRMRSYSFRIRTCRHGFTLFFHPLWGHAPTDEAVEAKLAQYNSFIVGMLQERAFYPFYTGMPVEVLGKRYTLRVYPRKRGQDGLYKRTLRLYRCGYQPREIRDRLGKFLREFATSYLEKRFYELAAKHGFTGQTVRIGKENQKRWGYHQKSRALTMLSYTVIQMEPDRIDHLIIHELCHSIQPNHKPAFWREVASRCKRGWEKHERFFDDPNTGIRYGIKRY